jgi:hypothetical protein
VLGFDLVVTAIPAGPFHSVFACGFERLMHTGLAAFGVYVFTVGIFGGDG